MSQTFPQPLLTTIFLKISFLAMGHQTSHTIMKREYVLLRGNKNGKGGTKENGYCAVNWSLMEVVLENYPVFMQKEESDTMRNDPWLVNLQLLPLVLQ